MMGGAVREDVVETADGCRLSYQTVGEGPCILLISGLGGVGSFWSSVRGYLARNHQVLTFDHRGTGRSDRPRGVYRVETLASDAVAVLDHAGVARADVVGHSTGGAIAQVLTLDTPTRVRRLVMSGSWARPDARFEALFNHRIEVLERAGPVAYAVQTQLLGYPPEWFNAHVGEVEKMITAAAEMLKDPKVAIARLRMLLVFDRARDLARIVTPVLVIGASDDMLIPIELTRELRRLISHALYAEMEGGHFFPRVHPERYAEHVLRFLDQH
jgi:aminoacrylate hydrolase